MSPVARATNRDRRLISKVTSRSGYPVREAMRQRAADLRVHLRQPSVIEDADDPAARVALLLVGAARDLDVHPF